MITLLLTLYCFSTCINNVMSNTESDLLRVLFKNCSPSTRPVGTPDKLVNVTFNIWLSQVISMDERNEKVTTKASYEMHWKNELCKWNPKDWNNLDVVYAQPSYVWTPDIVLYNNIDTGTDNIMKGTGHVYLYANGRNTWYPKVIATSATHFDVTYFPFDLQNCTFRFGSWTLDNTKLRILKVNSPMLDSGFKSPGWEVIKKETKVREVRYNGYPNAYTEITFSFTFLRKPLYYVVIAVVPCIILMAINLFSYFLPPASGERMGVVITILLAFAVFLQVISATLPRNSNSVSILSIFFIITMSSCTFSFLTACLVITLVHKGSENGSKPPPVWIRKHVLRFLSNRTTYTAIDSSNNSFEDFKTEETFCRLRKNSNRYLKRIHGRSSTRARRSSKSLLTEMLNSLKMINASMRKQNDRLKIITSTIERQDEQDDIEMEWKDLANGLDRISLWVFSALFITSLGILLIGYKKYN